MLWDLIRDFFVQHVFGGSDSSGTLFQTNTGGLYIFSEGSYEYDTANVNDIMYKVDGMYHIGFSDWLSTTATAISITIIVVLCCLFVYKIVRLIGGLIR